MPATDVDWRGFGNPDLSAEEVAATFSAAPTFAEVDGDDLDAVMLWRAVVHGTDDVAGRAVEDDGITADMLLTLCARRDSQARHTDGQNTADFETTGSPGLEPAQSALAHPMMPAAVFDHLAAHADPCWRAAAASNPRTPDAVIRELGMDTDDRVQYEVATSVAADLLPVHFTHFRLSNLGVLARRDDLTNAQLTLLARHPIAAIRTVVASRPALPAALRTVLAADPDRCVRQAANSRA